MRRVSAGALLLSAVLLAGCGSDGYEPSGPFRPLPEGAPPRVGPPPSSSAPDPDRPAEPGAEESDGDPNVVASGLAVPTGLALLPDGTAVVGERDTGRILQVFPDRSPARELMVVPGVDPAGDGGLLGLAVSPTYLEDGLLYAYLSTGTDNRVVRFPIGGTPNAVLTGLPRGEVHNGGGLVFGADGSLYVGTGDTGNPALGTDPLSLGGKVLRIDVFGGPVGAGPAFTSGHRDVTAV
ncbi:sorbosone dehydrogenase family protein [Blastococcus sp. TML/C7B]|nr:PQQ-dependent sugar dehydrogenase [Blastococcus sp. TML/C7B]